MITNLHIKNIGIIDDLESTVENRVWLIKLIQQNDI